MPSVLFAEKYGSLSALGMAKETTYGTAVAATNFVPVASDTLAQDPGLFFPELMQGIRDKQVYPLYGEQKNTGAITAPFFPTNGIPLIVATIGADAVTGTVSPYTHTITQLVTLPSYTIEKNIGNFKSLQFLGSRVNKLSIKAATGNTPAEFTADIVSQGVTVLDTPTTLVFVNEMPFAFAEYTLTLGATTISQATNFQLDIENGLKETYTFNLSNELQFLTPASLKVSGQFDVVFADLDTGTYDWFTQAITGTEASLAFTMAHPTVGSVKFSMPRVRLSKTAQDTKPADVVKEVINFEAIYQLSTTPNETIRAVVINAQATAF